MSSTNNVAGFQSMVLNGLAMPSAFEVITLSAALDLSTAANADRYGQILNLDPGGAHRDVTLEAEENRAGFWRAFINEADNAENLVIKDDGGNTIITINQNEFGVVVCNGTAWRRVLIATHALT